MEVGEHFFMKVGATFWAHFAKAGQNYLHGIYAFLSGGYYITWFLARE